MKNHSIAILVMASLCSATANAALKPADFRSGLPLEAEAGKPVQQLSVPDAVYAGVTEPALRDIQVFNAAGVAVPFAVCAPTQPPSLILNVPLPVFPLKAGMANPAAAHTQVTIDGKQTVDVQVDTPASTTGSTTGAPAAEAGSFVIDTRQLTDPLLALRLDWTALDGASEVHVRIESSDDLQSWEPLVDSATLLHSGAAIPAPDDATGAQLAASSTPATKPAEVLERVRIPIPTRGAAYLRVRRVDGGLALRINQAIAEVGRAQTQKDEQSFSATATPSPSDNEFDFDAAHRAPVDLAQISLPEANMRIAASLQSRADTTAAWREIWNGEVYTLGESPNVVRSPNPHFADDSDRYWRLVVRRGVESLGTAKPALDLAYRSPGLRFLAQGSGPFQLAFGSGRSGAGSATGCDALVADLDAKDLNAMTGAATSGVAITLGGDAALSTPVEPTSHRVYLLWGILIVGAGLLVVMALSLMRGSGAR